MDWLVFGGGRPCLLAGVAAVLVPGSRASGPVSRTKQYAIIEVPDVGRTSSIVTLIAELVVSCSRGHERPHEPRGLSRTGRLVDRITLLRR